MLPGELFSNQDDVCLRWVINWKKTTDFQVVGRCSAWCPQIALIHQVSDVFFLYFTEFNNVVATAFEFS